MKLHLMITKARYAFQNMARWEFDVASYSWSSIDFFLSNLKQTVMYLITACMRTRLETCSVWSTLKFLRNSSCHITGGVISRVTKRITNAAMVSKTLVVSNITVKIM